ncbi:MAG: DASS family sodium-coupled anion symporter [Cytophagia bacterium]|nr:DASS family sodium-coupled anion symporter [Cytophagia bacterium]
MRDKRRLISLILGPLVFMLLETIGGPESMPENAFHLLAMTIWIAIWWVTEAIPIAVTALLPIVLFPVFNVMDLASTTAAFGHKYVFLYVGGFVIAIAIEKWNLHKRIALTIINAIGTNMVNIILGFMLATAFLSMWISNTATSVMMLPIGMAIVSQLNDSALVEKRISDMFGKALMLAIAYSASIGGMATLIGTPPNLVLVGVVEETYGVEISFFQWFQFGLPVSVILLFACWKYLTKYAFKLKTHEFPGGRKEISLLLKELGKLGREEKYVLIVFVITAFCWISRSFLLQKLIPSLDDTIIAIVAAIVLFILPSSKKGERIINWEEAVKMPWGIILLFGGGMALAEAFGSTGLALWLGSQISMVDGIAMILVILILVATVNFLTELTSNLATTAMLLPILAPMAIAFNMNPYMLMVSATLAASCAFMLPVATPPNAVVFGSGYLRIPDMMRAGVWMNIISIFFITLMIYFLLPAIWNIVPDQYSNLVGE